MRGGLAAADVCGPGESWFVGDYCCPSGQAPWHEPDGSVYCKDIPCAPGETMDPVIGVCLQQQPKAPKGGVSTSGTAAAGGAAVLGTGRAGMAMGAALPWIVGAAVGLGALFAYKASSAGGAGGAR